MSRSHHTIRSRGAAWPATLETGKGWAMLLAIIAACEIGFWVVLVAGLVARYLLRRRRLGAVLLVDDADRTAELVAWIQRLTAAVVIWFVAFPLWATLFSGRTPR